MDLRLVPVSLSNLPSTFSNITSPARYDLQPDIHGRGETVCLCELEWSTQQSSFALSGHSKYLRYNTLGDAQCEVLLPLWGGSVLRPPVASTTVVVPRQAMTSLHLLTYYIQAHGKSHDN